MKTNLNKHQVIAIEKAIAELKKYAYAPTVELLEAVLENDHMKMLDNEVYQMQVVKK